MSESSFAAVHWLVLHTARLEWVKGKGCLWVCVLAPWCGETLECQVIALPGPDN